MAPVKKSKKSVKKRLTNETSPRSKTKHRKKKLFNKLGPHWNKRELERFYEAYRKYGHDWRKVAAAIRNSRSVDMVEALFNMNRAYLSLPEGTASVAGLIAMMTDYYTVMEGSGSEGEGHDTSEVPKTQKKRKLAKTQLSDSQDEVDRQHAVASTDGCLTFLKQARGNGTQRRATGKRTPRVPMQTSRDDIELPTPPSKRARRKLGGNDDVAHSLALALTNASNRGTELSDSSPVKMEVPQKGEKVYKRKVKAKEVEGNYSDDSGEPCNATEASRQRDNKLTSGDEFDALQALAELSAAMLPGTESSAQLKEERIENEKSNSPEDISTSSHGEEENAEPDDSLHHATSSAIYKRTPKPSRKLQQPQPTRSSLRKKRKPKLLEDDYPEDSSPKKSIKKKVMAQEEQSMKSMVRIKHIGQGLPQLKTVRPLEESTELSDTKSSPMDVVVSTDEQVSDSCPASLPQKPPPNRRKISLKKSLQERAKSSEKALRSSRSLSEQELLLKDKLSTSLLYPMAHRRCIFEWFYSAIDNPWFAKMEFVDYLNHVGLGHVPRLTRLEWSVIKSSLGRPRRFSERFLQEERENLKHYRESVRKYYTELRTGGREGLPTDLTKPLTVGNRVIAIHPKTREIHNGKILTVDHNKCNVLFDDLGVELVMDIDCMPSSALEYMPEGLRKQVDKCLSVKKEARLTKNIDFSMNHQGSNGKVTTNNSSLHQSNQPYLVSYSKARDEKEMEPEMLEIVNGSKIRAQAMVDAATKAASSVKEGEDTSKMIQEAVDLIGKPQPLHNGHANGSIEHHHISSPSDGSEKSEARMPSEIITSCVATCYLIQTCTERQYPPADVAQFIDAAVTSLQPQCPQNLPIYREIQTCMGRIKTQILALVPT